MAILLPTGPESLHVLHVYLLYEQLAQAGKLLLASFSNLFTFPHFGMALFQASYWSPDGNDRAPVLQVPIYLDEVLFSSTPSPYLNWSSMTFTDRYVTYAPPDSNFSLFNSFMLAYHEDSLFYWSPEEFLNGRYERRY